MKRTRQGFRRRNSTTTAKLSSSERKRCSGVNDSRPIWICSAGRTRMFRIQSVFSPQPEQMTVSWVPGSYAKAIAAVAWGFPVFRPAWVTTRKVSRGASPTPGDRAAAAVGRLLVRDAPAAV